MCDYKDQSAISDFDARKSSLVFLYNQIKVLSVTLMQGKVVPFFCTLELNIVMKHRELESRFQRVRTSCIDASRRGVKCLPMCP